MNKPVERRERIDLEAIIGAAGSNGRAWLHQPAVKWAGAALLGFLAILSAWSLRGSTTAPSYVTEPASRGNLTVIVTATGSVQPTNKVDVSSELSGTVRKVYVDYNSVVTAGQVLAELDTDKLKATVDSSRAKLTAVKAKVAEAEATVIEKDQELLRKKTLASKQFSSTQDLQAAQAAFDRATAAVASARADVGVAAADLALNETNLTKARLVSPIGGVVLTRNVDPGQTVAATLQAPVLFSIAEDLRQMELQVDVDEADVGKVKSGQAATFTVDSYPERRFPATIRDVRFASETIQGVVTYKAVLEIDNSELLLRPGMTATAEIKIAEVIDALLVPNTALRFTPPATEGGDQRSFLKRILPGPPSFRAASPREETGPNRNLWVLEDGTPKQIRIVIGQSDGRRTEIVDGDLHVGQPVIVDQLASRK